jgi:phosphoribosylformylglycinamidine synthase
LRLKPQAGDAIILFGGKTGRDGVGGATGSSKVQTKETVETAGAEVQKGNAIEERKIQRLFRNPEVTQLVKKSNDFGAGGVCVAIGELADGLRIDLDKIPLKYQGLSGTEIAISESQERMSVVVEAGDVDKFIAECAKENILAVQVAEVTEKANLTMVWKGKRSLILNDRSLIQMVSVWLLMRQLSILTYLCHLTKTSTLDSLYADLAGLLSELNFASQKGLSKPFLIAQ